MQLAVRECKTLRFNCVFSYLAVEVGPCVLNTRTKCLKESLETESEHGGTIILWTLELCGEQ